MSDNKVVSLLERQKQPPVVYTVQFAHGYDGSLEFKFTDFEDTPVNRERVASAMDRCAETLRQVDGQQGVSLAEAALALCAQLESEGQTCGREGAALRHQPFIENIRKATLHRQKEPTV